MWQGTQCGPSVAYVQDDKTSVKYATKQLFSLLTTPISSTCDAVSRPAFSSDSLLTRLTISSLGPDVCRLVGDADSLSTRPTMENVKSANPYPILFQDAKHEMTSVLPAHVLI
jgi:hypothetical protein